MQAASSVKNLTLAFVAGFIAVLVFHQGAWAALHFANIVPASKPAWSMAPVPPFNVPTILSQAFWGGVWAVVLALLMPATYGWNYWTSWILTGAILLTAVALFVVPLLKGMPVGAFSWQRFAIGAIVNGSWGFGTALLLRAMRVTAPRPFVS